MADKPAKVNAKQELFCNEYIIDMNGSQAAIRAGYSEKTSRVIACELLTKPNIQDRIAELQADRMARVRIDADYVLNSLHQVAERCMVAVPVTEYDSATKEEVETGEYRFEHSGANRSLELLGKHLGLFVERKEISGPNGDPLEMLVQEVKGRTLGPTYDD